MKKILLFLMAFITSTSAHATWQEGDILYVNGERWELLCKPIGWDSVFYHKLKDALPKDRVKTTANWSGYTAAWSVKNNKLVLDSILVEIYDKKSPLKTNFRKLTPDELAKVFGNRKLPIAATWFNQSVVAGKGKVIWYLHSGYHRHYAQELHLTFKRGKVAKRKLYNNGVIVDGFSIAEIKSAEELRQKVMLPSEKYPLLKGKRVIFSIKQARADQFGNLLDCEIKAHSRDIPDNSPELRQAAIDFKAALKAVKPWKTWRVNGKLVCLFQDWNVPYRFNP